MTDITRNVDGINIIISCHGRIGTPQDLRNMNQPDRIRVPDNTTFHFYTEPGNFFWCPNAYDIQHHVLCESIRRRGGYTNGINFSVSNGDIPNFILGVEPNIDRFMSRVVLCNRNDGTPSILLNMNDLQNQGILGTSFTLRDILTLISRRRFDRERLGANDRVHYHCFFCQQGTVPPFWRNAYNAAIANDNVLRSRQSQPLTPPRLMPRQRNMNLTQSQERQRRAFIAGRLSGTVQDSHWLTPTGPPSYTMNESTTPSPGQAARRTSSLSRTFSRSLFAPPQMQGLPISSLFPTRQENTTRQENKMEIDEEEKDDLDNLDDL